MVSDALDELGLSGVLIGLGVRHAATATTVGRALPIAFEPKAADEAAYRFGGGVGRPLEAVLRVMERGHFLVFDLGGSRQAACWGGLASELAADRGVAGVAIWGACRDVQDIQDLGFPVWSSSVCPRRSRNDFSFGSIGKPITIDGTRVQSDDIVVADSTGVVVVAQAREDAVAETLTRIIDQERRLLAQLGGVGEIDWDAI